MTDSLHIAPCTFEAVKFACLNYHYTRSTPSGKLISYGVWERGRFIGCVIYGRGATPEIGSPFRIEQTEVCELARVALRQHECPVSRIIAITLRLLRRSNPGLKIVVSFADTTQGHHGGIYQAGGWIYTGSKEYHAYQVNGTIVHPRSLGAKYGIGGQSIPWLRTHVDPDARRINNGVKHRYVMPLTDDMRERVRPLARPYPKRVAT